MQANDGDRRTNHTIAPSTLHTHTLCESKQMYLFVSCNYSKNYSKRFIWIGAFCILYGFTCDHINRTKWTMLQRNKPNTRAILNVWPVVFHRNQSWQSFTQFIAMHFEFGSHICGCVLNQCTECTMSRWNPIKWIECEISHRDFSALAIQTEHFMLPGECVTGHTMAMRWPNGSTTLASQPKRKEKCTMKTRERIKKKPLRPSRVFNQCVIVSVCVCDIVHICERTIQIPWTSCYDGNSISVNFDSKCIFK